MQIYQIWNFFHMRKSLRDHIEGKKHHCFIKQLKFALNTIKR